MPAHHGHQLRCACGSGAGAQGDPASSPSADIDLADLSNHVGSARVALASRAGTTPPQAYAHATRLERARQALASVQHAVREVGCTDGHVPACSQRREVVEAKWQKKTLQNVQMHVQLFFWSFMQ